MKIEHRIGGWYGNYTNVNNTATMATTVLTKIPMRPTPIARTKGSAGNLLVEFMEAGGQLSPEEQPFFAISREALKSGTTYLTPTSHDEFFRNGTATPIFYVQRFIEIGSPAVGWLLLVNTIFRTHAGG